MQRDRPDRNADEMTRAFKYPLRPTRAQAATLARWLGLCCDLYNKRRAPCS